MKLTNEKFGDYDLAIRIVPEENLVIVRVTARFVDNRDLGIATQEAMTREHMQEVSASVLALSLAKMLEMVDQTMSHWDEGVAHE